MFGFIAVRCVSFALTLLTVSVLVRCSQSQPQSAFAFYRNIPVVDRTNRNIVHEAKPISAKQLRLIQYAEEVRDLFPVDHWIMLELTEQSMLRSVFRIIQVDGHWIVFDHEANRILSFSEDGHFEHPIGQAGQGPDEYNKIRDIIPIFDHQIAAIDSQTGVVFIYDLQGRLVRKTAKIGTSGDGGRFPITQAFIWNQPDRFFLADFQVDSPAVPQHVALDYAMPEGKLLFGFGKRFDVYQNWLTTHRIPGRYYSCFKEINGRIWAASPLLAEIDIFETDGSFFKRVRGAHPNYISANDYLETGPDPEGLRALRLKKMVNFQLFQFENTVIQYLTGGIHHRFNIYDLDGNLLRSALKVDNLSSLTKGATDTYVFGSLDFLSTDAYRLNQDEMSLMREAGWTEANSLEINPMLCLRRPAWDSE